MAVNPFDFVKSINQDKNDLIRKGGYNEKDYIPYIINKNFSLFVDTLFDANQMNINNSLDNQKQFDYYRESVKRKKRFISWPKNNKNEELLLLSNKLSISINKAKEILRTLSKENIDNIISKLKQSEGV